MNAKIITLILVFILSISIAYAETPYPYASNPYSCTRYYSFDGCDSTDCADEIGSLDFTGQNSPTIETSDLPGLGNMVTFVKGSSQKFFTAATLELTDTSWTWLMWNEQHATGENTLVAHWFDAGSLRSYYAIAGDGGANLHLGHRFTDDGANGGTIIEGANNYYTLNSWVHTAVTLNTSGNFYVYRNGTLFETLDCQTDCDPFNANVELSIGGAGGGPSSFSDSSIDEFLICPELTNAQIEIIYSGNYPQDETPPVLSNINVTSNPLGDTTEPYNSSGDLTPNFEFDTDDASNCDISDSNTTNWVDCKVTGGNAHQCRIPFNDKLTFYQDFVYSNCTNSVGLSNYDEWNVWTADFPFIAYGSLILSKGGVVLRECR